MKKKIFIIGGSSDIGIEVIKKFISNNCKVVAHYNKEFDKLKKLKKNNNSRLELFQFDLRDITKLESYLHRNKKFFEDSNIFVNLAGYNDSKKLDSVSSKDLIEHLNVNYIASILISRIILKNSVKKRWGRILFSSSVGTKFGGGITSFCYSLSKFLNEFIPKEYVKCSQYNVLTNCIKIGVTDTKIHLKSKNKNLKKRISLIPSKKIAKPLDIAEFIYFLCSEKNQFITNKVLDITGGE